PRPTLPPTAASGGPPSRREPMKSLIAFVTVTMAGVALAASSALASNGITRPDDRAIGPRSEPATAVFSGSDFGHVRPDARPVRSRSTEVSTPASAPVVIHATGSGFEWGDAGIGAGAGAGLVLVVLGGLLLVRHTRTDPRTA